MKSWNRLFFLALVAFFVTVPNYSAALTSPVELERSQAEVDEMEAALLRIKADNPKRYLRILELRQKSPEHYNRLAQQALREYKKLQRLRRLVPANVSLQEEMWKNRTRLSEIMRNMRGTKEGPGRVIMISQMEKVLQSQFDLRIRMKRNRLNRAEDLLKDKLRRLQAEEGQQQEFVGRWKSRLLAKVSDTSRSRTAAPKRKTKR